MRCTLRSNPTLCHDTYRPRHMPETVSETTALTGSHATAPNCGCAGVKLPISTVLLFTQLWASLRPVTPSWPALASKCSRHSRIWGLEPKEVVNCGHVQLKLCWFSKFLKWCILKIERASRSLPFQWQLEKTLTVTVTCRKRQPVTAATFERREVWEWRTQTHAHTCDFSAILV